MRKRRIVAESQGGDTAPRRQGPGSGLASRGMRSLGRGLQAIALIVLLVGLLFGMQGGRDAMSWELGLLIGGVAIFLIGLQLQRRG